jgi:hypothetical protein
MIADIAVDWSAHGAERALRRQGQAFNPAARRRFR